MKRLFPFALAAIGFALIGGCSKPADGGSTATGTSAGSTGGSASSTALPSEATLRLKAKLGDKYTMVTTVETSADIPTPDGKSQSGSMTLTATEDHSCTKVEGTNMTWESKNIDVQATGTGPFAAQAETAKSQQKGKSETKIRDERNGVVGDKGEESLALVYPEKAVKIGDTWTGQTNLMGANVQIEFKLEKFEVVNGKTCAVIAATITGGDKLKSDGPLTLIVDTANGWPVKGTGAFTMLPQPGITAKMKVQMDVK